MKRHILLKWTFVPLVRLYVKEIEGLENFPKKGSFVMVSNHNSFPDEAIIAFSLIKKGQKRFGGIATFRPYKKTFLNKIIIKAIDNILRFFFIIISPFDGDPVLRAVAALKKETAFLVFPEAQQNYGNKVLLKGKTGAARIALLAKVPIVPIGIKGSEKIIPKNTYLSRFHRMSMFIGKPLTFEKFYGKEDDKEALETVTRIFMKKIAKLCGKTYPH